MDDLTLLTAGGPRAATRHRRRWTRAELEPDTNCPPWTVRRLASHVLKNQLFWAGCVTGQDLMPQAEAMAAVPYDGDLTPIAADVADQVMRALAHRRSAGGAPRHAVRRAARCRGRRTSPSIDAAAHAWDLSASLGRPIEFPAEWIPGMTGVVELTCTEHTVELGLVKPPVEPPADATDTQRLMAGRPDRGTVDSPSASGQPWTVPSPPSTSRRIPHRVDSRYVAARIHAVHLVSPANLLGEHAAEHAAFRPQPSAVQSSTR